MFKLFALTAILAVVAARPSHLESAPLVYSAPTAYYQEPAYAKVGAVVKSIPTAVSHQSQSIVHSSANVVEPIVAPVVRSYAAAPVYNTYSAPLHYAAAPVQYGAPLVHSYAANAPSYRSYASPLTYAAASPLSYAATYAAPAHYSAW